MDEVQEYAKEIINENWQDIIVEYTVGFTNIAGIQEKFSFVYDELTDIEDSLIIELPVILYQTRQTPPENMVAAIPYQFDPDPLSCRLVSSNEPNEIDALSEFTHAIWVLVDTEAVPHPALNMKLFVQKLIEWTDEKLFKL
jgi:hypothetical protein